MKKFASFLIFFLSVSVFSQQISSSFEKYPVFSECGDVEISELKECFNFTLKEWVYSNYKMPAIVASENYQGVVNVFFEIDKEGIFKVLYTDAVYNELKVEALRVFNSLPQITPATYNGKPAYVQFTLPILIPLEAPSKANKEVDSENKKEDILKNEYDSLESIPYSNQEYLSNISIPLSHQNYSRFDPSLNRVGLNNHTAQKPYVFSEVNKYYDFQAEKSTLMKERKTWLGKKWWNEHLVAFSGKDYWITLDPGVDLQMGKDLDADINTYNNTRLVNLQGGLGSSFGFAATIFESQGRFADYFNRFAEARRPAGGNPAIIPGQGVAKAFKSDSYDYPIAIGHVSYTPSKWVNFQLGHGKNFIGDGYRSVLLSDNASPYPFLKVNTSFWKIKYTNTWMSLRDVRADVTEGGSFRTKYIANHYLSYNVTKRLNIGLFESVIWENDNDRGFDFNFLNPIIFYRAIEFSTGSRGGNAIIGLSTKYKFTDRVNAYGQLVIDEFSTSDIFGGEGSYKNKVGYQLGAKYYDALGVKNLMLQAEYNRVRPYTYSHNTVVLNYGHNNQSLAHTFGANFSEFIAIARYHRGRIFADAKIIIAKRGFDFNTTDDSLFYGGNIYGTEDDRPADIGNDLAQGNTTDFFHAEIEGGYLINPTTNLKLYGSLIFRNFSPSFNTESVFDNQTTWLNIGLRTDLFNWYKDF